MGRASLLQCLHGESVTQQVQLMRAQPPGSGQAPRLQGSEVFEGSSPVVAGQVLVELFLEGLEAVAVGGAGAETGQVKAWRVGQVDGEGLRQHQELVFL